MQKDEEKMKHFFAWMKNNFDIKLINKTRVKDLPGFGNSLLANQMIMKEDIILEIPQRVFLSMENACQDEIIKKLILSKNIWFEKKTIFALFLWTQQYINEKSFWKPYFEILPTDYSNTITWNIDEINILKRKDLIETLCEKKEHMENEFMKLKELILRNDDPDVQKLKDMQIVDFKRIFALIESRTLYYQNPYDQESAIGTLVPYYDFCNHNFLQDINAFKYFYYDKMKKMYILKAYKNFEENEQIFICYGNYNNFHFAKLYGFIPSANIFNNFIEIKTKTELKLMFGSNSKIILENFYKKTEIIKKLFPHFCKKNLIDKKKIELEDFIKIQIENKDEKSNYSWETQIFLYIFSLNLDDLCKQQLENIIFNDLNEEIKKKKLYKILFYSLKDYLLNEIYGIHQIEVSKIKKNNENFNLASSYLEYELKLIKSLEI